MAQRIAIIDHGKIVGAGKVDELKERTKTNSLEEAFLKLTGSDIRDEQGGAAENMRMMHRAWRR
jgi:ABC-2 type transport system ATP-binding protein